MTTELTKDPTVLDVPKPDSIDQMRSLDESATGSCWWHKWGKWKDVKSGSVTIDDRKIGNFIYQERRCLRCNQVELNKITT